MEKTKGFRLPKAGYFHPVKTPGDYVELAPATTEQKRVFNHRGGKQRMQCRMPFERHRGVRQLGHYSDGFVKI